MSRSAIHVPSANSFKLKSRGPTAGEAKCPATVSVPSLPAYSPSQVPGHPPERFPVRWISEEGTL
jgi:hypothetical protein